ncbi:MAG: hypothetical protein ABIH39_05110 [Candidatus Margulisiibacteriota bacterium]
MKKILILGCVILMLITVSAFAADDVSLSDKKMVIGLDMPTIGWLNKNDQGEITSMWGFNAALGFSYRSYFNPVKVNQFNGYWHAGTLIVLLPYVGIGADYVWDNGFYAGIGTYYIFPGVHVGIMF